MNNEKNKFSQIAGEKLENFEVPYNEEHWAEMSQKLDAFGSLPTPKSSLPSKLMLAGFASVAVVALWYVLKNNTDQDTAVQVETPVSEQIKQESNTSNQSEEVLEDQQSGGVESEIKITGSSVKNQKEKTVEEKFDRYAGYSEEQIKNEGKEYVNEVVENQKSNIPAEPRIDNSALKTEIVVKSKVLCEGEEISFDIDKEVEGASYFWNFGDKGLTSRKIRPKHIFHKEGTYEVWLLVSIGEKNDYKAKEVVVIEKKPKLEITRVEKEISLNWPYVTFESKSDIISEFEWEFNGNQKANGSKVDFLVNHKGDFELILTGKGNNQCIGVEQLLVSTERGVRMNVEENFTPNSSNGTNDLFFPIELAVSDVPFTLTILDKSGQVVFQTSDRTVAWNGAMNNNGAPLPEGLYFWKVSFKDNKGKTHNQEGKINILR